MICEMAIEDLNEMVEEGLSPTPRDIVRLNALGLACELSQGCATYYEMPRVAFLGKSITFREPTLGHLFWIDSALRYCDRTDLSTVIAVEAFALSRPPESLPDSCDRPAVSAAIDKFTTEDLKPFTIDQISCALKYAKDGAKATAHEYPVARPGAEHLDNVPASIGVGVLIETLSMGLGLSIADTYKLTRSQATSLQEFAAARNGFDLAKSARATALADYIATKEEIVHRLKEEKEHHG